MSEEDFMTVNTDAYQDAVNKLMAYVDQTVNFAKGELPEVCKEILIYGAAQNYFWIWLSWQHSMVKNFI